MLPGGWARPGENNHAVMFFVQREEKPEGSHPRPPPLSTPRLQTHENLSTAENNDGDDESDENSHFLFAIINTNSREGLAFHDMAGDIPPHLRRRFVLCLEHVPRARLESSYFW